MSFKASCSLNKSTAPDFREFYDSVVTPQLFLSLNPGLVRIEELSSGKYLGYLKPIQFPGMKVTSIVEFDVSFSERELIVSCIQGSIKQSYEGNKVFAKLLSRLIPDVCSSNRITYDIKTDRLINEANLSVSFQLPPWLPLPADVIEKRGSDAIQSNISTDLENMLDAVFEKYESWLEQQI